ncbi:MULTISPECIES: hypothetical protein [unclassified Microcoleus]
MKLFLKLRIFTRTFEKAIALSNSFYAWRLVTCVRAIAFGMIWAIACA